MSRTAAQIRQEFIDFFREKHAHAFVPSSPVVPHDDPTLLFTNAGMNQFKPYFLGTETPKQRRVANSQKCIRAGGKHNDLDDVGHDTYHHTFFEMLGNWSFGDYFKKEAIAWAWELLVDVWGLDPTRLHATYFEGDEKEGLEPDNEARELWLEILPPERVHPGNKKDNFWEMGETGPCGPCSEIHVDLTPDKSGAKLVNAGDARAIEIWNLVFIQFNAAWRPGGEQALREFEKIKSPRDWQGDENEGRRIARVEQFGTADHDEFLARNRTLTPLPAKHVDTGMGLERVAAVIQGHNNNYATDVFVPIVQAIEKLTGHVYGGRDQGAEGPRGQGSEGPRVEGAEGGAGILPATRYAAFVPGNMRDEACRVIADHVRCLTFALTDGAVPDRDGRGYVLRRILRRAVRFGWQYLDLHKPFLCDLVDTVVDMMGDAFPELRKNPAHVKAIIREEEESFERTLDRGIDLFNGAVLRALSTTLLKSDNFDELRLVDSEHNVTLARGTGPKVRRENPRTITIDVVSCSQDAVKAVFAEPPAISGRDAFNLHDTYGFSIDLTQIMANEKGLRVDIDEYERLMEEARELARGTGSSASNAEEEAERETAQREDEPTDDSAKYNERLYCKSRITTLTRLNARGERGPAVEGEHVTFCVASTCFYAEAGGQVSDIGTVTTKHGEIEVTNVRKLIGTTPGGEPIAVIVHTGRVVRGEISSGEDCDLTVSSKRQATMKNHTATHLMNWALREVLGDHVQQKGSLVDPDKTRFDFSHPKALSPAEIERVEQLVNEQIKRNLPVDYQNVPQAEALKINGLRAVFGEKYPDVVRVMSIGPKVAELLANPDNPEWRQYSIEFCGGTHLRQTGDIGHFVITAEEAVAKGIRRIVAITGPAAKIVEEAGAALLLEAEELKQGPPEEVPAGLAKLQEALTSAQLPVRHRTRIHALLGELQQIAKQQHKAEAADAAGVVNAKVDELLKSAEKIGATTVVVAEMPDVPVEQLKGGADRVKQTCKSAAVLFGVRAGDKALLLAAMSDDLIKRGVKAGDLVKAVAPHVKGGGGGPPTMAQAGGKAPEKLDEALAAGKAWIGEKLG